MQASEFYINDILHKISIKKFCRYDVIKISSSGTKLSIKNHYFNESWSTQKFDSSRFKSKNCIVTIIKNDELLWITDFVKFHIKHHQLDVIVIYDNGSTEYTQQVLEKCLSAKVLTIFYSKCAFFLWFYS